MKDEIQNPPYKKKKNKKKYLRPPSHILRLCIIWSFVLILYFLSMPFWSATLYINEDLEGTTNFSQAKYSYATQEEIDSVNKELVSALDSLEKLPEKDVVKDSTVYNASVNTMQLNWEYHISEDVNINEIYQNIEKSKSLERNLYTTKSLDELAKVTLKAQRLLAPAVSISQNALQIIFGGSIAESYGYANSTGAVANSLYAYALIFIPVVGFFVASFDKSKHIKHIVAMLGSILSIMDIMFIIYPYVAIGSVLSIIMYIIVCVLTVFSIYAKQQEDYIVKHPELETEFTEKHPQFLKALINAKTFGVLPTVTDKKEQEVISARNAKKKREKRNKK